MFPSRDIEKIESSIVEFLAARLPVEKQALMTAPSLFDLGLDSYAFVEMITAIEKSCAIRFSTEDLMSPGFRSVRGIVNAVQKNLTP